MDRATNQGTLSRDPTTPALLQLRHLRAETQWSTSADTEWGTMKADPLEALQDELARSPGDLEEVTRVGAELRVKVLGQPARWHVKVYNGDVVVQRDQGNPMKAGRSDWPPGTLARVVQRLVRRDGTTGAARSSGGRAPSSPRASATTTTVTDSSAETAAVPAPGTGSFDVRDNGHRPTADASKKEPGGLGVSYLGGFASHAARVVGGGYWTVRFDTDAIRVFWGSQKGSLTGTYRWSLVREEAWATVEAVRFATAQGARANIPALALFGVLGLAASRDPGAFLSITYPDGDVLFRTGAPAPLLRMELDKVVVQVPELASIVTFDGEPLASAAPSAGTPARADEGAAVVQRIRELGELHAAGLLTDEEFATKKQDLLGRL